MPYYLILLILFCNVLYASADFQNVRLVWTENPQNQATIIWESDKATEGDFIKVWEEGKPQMIFAGTKAEAYDTGFSKKKGKPKGSSNTGRWYFRHVKMVGLKPSTKYYMTAHSKGKETRKYHFTTAPEDERTFKLLYVGDSRTRVEVAAKISQQLGEIAAQDPEVLAVIHGGDFANAPVLKDWNPGSLLGIKQLPQMEIAPDNSGRR